MGYPTPLSMRRNMASRPPKIATVDFDDAELPTEVVAVTRNLFDTSQGLLFDSAKQFTMYAHHHMQKGSPDIDKALTNIMMAGKILDHLITTENKEKDPVK